MASQGATDLSQLLKSMNPSLNPSTFVFGHIPSKSDIDTSNILKLLSDLPIQCLFLENEGWTVIIEQSVAESIQLQSTFISRMITLNVHSSLDAVGFMAAISTRLAKDLEVGVNPVSGFFHDHLFVPDGTEDKVMEVLKNMAEEQT